MRCCCSGSVARLPNVSEDPLGLSAGINAYRYVSDNPQNRTDPSGLYEKDVHYWLTYFLAKKMGCFTEEEARKIAYYTQEVDYDPATTPGPGWVAILPGPLGYLSWAVPDERQMQVNMDYHALHPGSHQPYLDRLWPQGSGFNPQQLGYYLHYLQDTFSHAGYDNPMYGHGLDLHHPDKTASDVEKAVRMAQEVWRALKRYAKQLNLCGCKEWDDPSWDQVRRFARSPGGPANREINDQELARKKEILGLD